MFEKEAEEYYYKKIFAETNPKNETELKEKFLQTFKDSAEFGYNKANEWHYPSKGELPKNENRVWLYFGVDDYNDGQFIRGRFWCDGCGWYHNFKIR